MIRYDRVTCLVTLAWLSFSGVLAQEKTATIANPLGVTANDCKACHSSHYQEWERSYHAKTMVAMHAGFKRYITTQEQAKGRALNRNELMGCVGCHAPAMRFSSDEDFARLAQLVKTDQREALAGLSVDCVACHALSASGHPEVKPPEGIDKQVYYGTIKNPVNPGHGAQYASQMEKSEFCKSCHTYVTPADMKVSADWDIVCSLTFDAWAAGPYGPKAAKADMRECQSCHMEKKDGKAAEIDGVPTRKVSSHLFPGWHDAAALRGATEIALATKAGAGGDTELIVTINNKAGHRLPDT
ncbi:MAG: hypothetical protein HY644_12130 [Acidobacteria bacterium]|nr:hypothetical protein [Acidobacteriota bacterium]